MSQQQPDGIVSQGQVQGGDKKQQHGPVSLLLEALT